MGMFETACVGNDVANTFALATEEGMHGSFYCMPGQQPQIW
jgi:hypothetical protein